ncbi:hypothetical protein WR25_09570 isoform F [Diploscapter pachys]|uniref:Uncharacterized protein n=1 Tax=Diploscapter pachys TaxID=2018661 RepID=A0A2A2KXJ0_9BILA|nr:hypothetical protein WR25_09570 isoform F [Diploscapter pachys]
MLNIRLFSLIFLFIFIRCSVGAFVEWNNDKTAFAIDVFEDGKPKIQIYNAEGNLTETIDLNGTSKVSALAFDGYEYMIAVGMEDGSVHIIDIQRRFEPLQIVAPNSNEVAFLKFDSDYHKFDEEKKKKNAWMFLGHGMYNVLWVIYKNSNVRNYRFKLNGTEPTPVFDKDPVQDLKLNGDFVGIRRTQIPDSSNGYFTNEVVIAHGNEIHQLSFTTNKLIKSYPSTTTIEYFNLTPDHCVVPTGPDTRIDPCADNPKRYVAFVRETGEKLPTLIMDDLNKTNSDSPIIKIPNYEYFKHPIVLYGRQFVASDNGTHVFVQSLRNAELNIGLDKGNMDEIAAISTKGIEWNLYVGTVKGNMFVFSATATEDGQPSWEWSENDSLNVGDKVCFDEVVPL